MPQPKTLKTGRLIRSATFDRATADTDARTVEVSFSSEARIPRWFGVEILDHSPTSVRLGRLNAGAPLLLQHDHEDQIGVVESAVIGADRKGRAVVRFGKSALAEEVFQDVVDGIRRNVSVGYDIHRMTLEETGDEGDTYRATDWEPAEISIVSVPADTTVGVGRAGENDHQTIIEKDKRTMDEDEKNEGGVAAPAATRSNVEVGAADSARAEANAIKRERNRVSEIRSIGDRFEKAIPGMRARVDAAINNGDTTEAFRVAVMDAMPNATPVDTTAEIGMSDREVREFSVVRAINALIDNDWSEAGLEQEASRAHAKLLGRKSRGFFIPTDVLRRGVNGQTRGMTVGTATAGGNLVGTDLLSASFIEMLRSKLVLDSLGVTILSDLVGDVAVPRQTGGATGYHVTEGNAPTASNGTFDQVGMTPKTAGAYTEYSRKLMNQSSLDIEALVRLDLAKALAQTINLGGINGSGASGEPTGILNTTGIGDVAGGTNGLAPTLDHLIDLETAIAIDNADVETLAFLTNTKVRGKLKKTAVETGHPARVWPIGASELLGYRALVSNLVPSTLDKGTSTGVCSAIILGNFSDMLIGFWSGLDIQVNPYALDTTGGVRVTAFQDYDVNVRHPESFAAMQDALTA